jgi:exopolysaccharide biosynthesis polyprenyl glycosylphosphotransferase
MLLDVLAVTLAAITTFSLRYLSGFDDYDLENSLDQYLIRVGVLYLSLPLLISIFRQNLLYKYKVYSSAATQFAFIVRSVLLNSILLIAILFFVREDVIQHSRSNVIIFALSTILYCSLLRIWAFRKWLINVIAGKSLKRILLIGGGEAAQKLTQMAESTHTTPFKIIAAVVRDDSSTQFAPDTIILDHVPVIREVALAYDLDEVMIAEDSLPYEDALRVITECREAGIIVNLLSDHFKVIHERVTKNSSEFINIATAHLASGIHGLYALYAKRPIDLVGSFLLLLGLSPLFAAVAIVIKMTSKGPIFYRTTVVGINGEHFVWYKFRTMRLSEATAHKEHVVEHIRLGTRPTGKLENDPRITPIGKWLRKHSIDELPQLYSVLIGDMSLIGPRPCLPYEYEQYQEWHKERFVVRPGITGLWQVSGRSAVSFNDMVILDLYYIHNLSFWLDTAILIRTFGVVLTGKGGG